MVASDKFPSNAKQSMRCDSTANCDPSLKRMIDRRSDAAWTAIQPSMRMIDRRSDTMAVLLSVQDQPWRSQDFGPS